MKISSYQTALIIPALLLSVVTALWLNGRYQEIKTTTFEKNKTDTAAYIKSRASALLKPQDFADGNAAHQQQVFRSFFANIQTPALNRIKVWDRNFTVIWSNLNEVIGQRYPDNQEVKEALEGNVEYEIGKEKLEHFSERQFVELSETYVPIPDTNENIVGVIEVYQSTIALHEDINARFQKLTLQVSVLVLIIYSLLALLARQILQAKAVSIRDNPI